MPAPITMTSKTCLSMSCRKRDSISIFSLLYLPVRPSARPSTTVPTFEASLVQRVEGDVVEGGDDQVGPSVVKRLFVVGPRQAEGRHIPAFRSLHPVGGILDDEALLMRNA